MARNTRIRRALLIGSPGPLCVPERRLPGVAHDLREMATELEAWNFECTQLFDHQATRDGILGSLRDLRDEVTADHDVVIYYVGHGGRRRIQGADRPAWNYLVPVDHATDQFRGVAEVELADIVHALCERTPNVTVVLDCCHAATMVRDNDNAAIERIRAFNDVGIEAAEGTVREATPIEWERLPRELRDRLGDGGKVLRAQLDPESHPEAVRLVATGADSSAYEYKDDGRESGYVGYRGYFTTELCRALAQARGSRWPWDTIIGRVRERICQRRGAATQRPQVEGPRERLPFSLTEFDDVRSHLGIVVHDDQSAWIRAGRLHGLTKGDVLTIIDDYGREVNRAQVDELFDDSALVSMNTRAREEQMSVALPARVQLRKTIGLTPSATRVEGLAERIARARRLARSQEADNALFRVDLVDEELHLSGPSWLSRRPWPSDPSGVEALVSDVEQVAQAELMSELLGSSPGMGKITCNVEVVAESPTGEVRPVRDGQSIRIGQWLCARVTHTTDHKPPIYCNMFGRGIDRRIGLISRSEPSGVEVRAGESRWIGRRSGGLPGVGFSWPPEVPSATFGRGDLLFVISRRPLDLRGWCDEEGSKSAGGRVLRRAGHLPPELGEQLMWTSVRFELKVEK
ncbi:MAG: caspase family protein [Myxococcota bacterium]